MTTPDKKALQISYTSTMSDMRSELSPIERAWSRLLHSSVGAAIGGLFGSILLRPRSLATGASLALIVLAGAYTLTMIYGIPLNPTESLLAFGFGWCIGLLYDLFFIVSHRQTR